MYFIIASAADTNYSRGLIVHLDIPSSIKTNGCKKSIIRTNTIKLSGKYLFFGIAKLIYIMVLSHRPFISIYVLIMRS
jgi:hypothetical protein